MLQTDACVTSKGRFHFELFWPKFEGYDDIVTESWVQPTGYTDPLARLDKMLRNLVRAL